MYNISNVVEYKYKEVASGNTPVKDLKTVLKDSTKDSKLL